MKTCIGNEQTRCRVACVEQSFVLDFLFLFDEAKRKTHSIFLSICSSYFENFTKTIEGGN